MKNWAILGDISFDILSSPHSYSHRSAVTWAEHALIQGKSKLEWTGDELDEIAFEILLHSHLVKTETQLRLLREAKEKHQPMALVMGDGDYKGPYVITGIDTNINTTTPGGRVRSATINLTLKEYTGEFIPLPPTEGLVDSLLTFIDAKVGTNLKNTAQLALGYARSAANIINTGLNAYQQIKDNPLSALNSLAELTAITHQAIEPLNQLSQITDMVNDGQALVKASNQALKEVRQAVDYLKDNRLGSVTARVNASSGCMNNASRSLSQANTNALILCVNVATRRLSS